MFYPGNKEELLRIIEYCFLHEAGPGNVPASVSQKLSENAFGVVPHAGYVYSGPIAAWVYHHLASLGKPDVVVLIGPNHTGHGMPVSIYPNAEWRTPLGSVKVDKSIADQLLVRSNIFVLDARAHLYEHSLEVQLPFLQYIYGNDFTIVPITCMDQRLKTMRALAEALKDVINSNPHIRFVVLASSDLNHYDSHEETLAKDQKVLDAIISKNVEELYNVIKEYDITACGYGAIAAVMLTATGEPQVLKHATSGDTGGDFTRTVGYAAIVWR